MRNHVWALVCAVGLLTEAGCGEEAGEDSALNQPPAASEFSTSMEEDSTVTIPLLAHVVDPEGDPLRLVEVSADPPSTVQILPKGAVAFTPPQDFFGAVRLSYVVSAGWHRLAVEHTVTVTPVADAPTAVDQQKTLHRAGPVVLSGVDPDGDAITHQIVDPPQHGVLSGTAPDLVYTAQVGFVGEDSFTFRISDGALDSRLARVTLQLVRGTAPVTAPRAITLDEDTSGGLRLSGADADGDELTFEITTPPQHGTLSGTPPDLVYTPAPDYFGPDSLAYTVADGYLPPVAATATVQVRAINDPPVGEASSLAVNEDGLATLTLLGSDPDGGLVAFDIVSPPSHGTLSPGATPSRTYQPAPNYHGPDSFTFRLFDGYLTSAPVTVTIAVAPVPDLPTAESLVATAQEDGVVSFTLRGADGDGDPLTYALLTQPAHGALVGAAPNLVYVPEPDFSGTEVLTYAVSAGGATTPPANVTITVSPVNDAPVARDGAVATDEDVEVGLLLQASDVDSATLTYTVTAPPADGQLLGSGAALTYRPARDAFGTRTLTFSARDSAGATATGTVTIAIAPINDPPVAVGEDVMVELDEPAVLALTDNDSDPDGDTFTVASVSAPAHGTAVLDGETLTYTPAAGFVGAEDLTYTLVDEHGASATAHARIGVETVAPGLPLEVIARPGVISAALRPSPSISEDGRFVAFTASAALVAGDTNGLMDVYLYDRGLRTLRLVSHTASGAAGSAVSRSPQLSGDGRYVAFTSTASDLVPGDTGAVDVFRYDRLTDEVVRVSVAANGGQANGDSDQPQISDDGTVVAFSSTAFNLVADDVNGTSDIFVRDLAAGTNRLISVASTGSQADLASQNPALSGDGRVVAFSSLATNLVAGDTNQVEDVFVHELATDVTARVSVTSTGVQADGVSRFPSLSRDGRFISFLSRASNLVPPTAALFFAYVHDRQSRITLRGAESDVQSAWLSSDGRYLSLHTGSGAFVRDRFAGTSRALPGIGASRLFPVISGDGRYIAFLNGTTGDVLVAPN